MEEKELTPIDKIFDEDNTENIVLYNKNNEPVEFEQIFIMPLDGADYCILKPIVPLEGMGEDEGIVFTLQEVDDEEQLVVVQDQEIVDKVFDEYTRLLKESMED